MKWYCVKMTVTAMVKAESPEKAHEIAMADNRVRLGIQMSLDAGEKHGEPPYDVAFNIEGCVDVNEAEDGSPEVEVAREELDRHVARIAEQK